MPPASAVSGASRKAKAASAAPPANAAICPTWANSPRGVQVVLWDDRVFTIPAELPLPCNVEVKVRLRKVTPEGTQEVVRLHTAKPGENPINWQFRRAASRSAAPR
jgi:hypothetical protein